MFWIFAPFTSMLTFVPSVTESSRDAAVAAHHRQRVPTRQKTATMSPPPAMAAAAGGSDRDGSPRSAKKDIDRGFWVGHPLSKLVFEHRLPLNHI